MKVSFARIAEQWEKHGVAAMFRTLHSGTGPRNEICARDAAELFARPMKSEARAARAHAKRDLERRQRLSALCVKHVVS